MWLSASHEADKSTKQTSLADWIKCDRLISGVSTATANGSSCTATFVLDTSNQTETLDFSFSIMDCPVRSPKKQEPQYQILQGNIKLCYVENQGSQ